MKSNFLIQYFKFRPLLFRMFLFGIFIVISLLVYEELTSPLQQPEATSIVSKVPPHSEPPTEAARNEHSVPPNYPKYLAIPKLSINTNVYAVGTTKEGAVDAPETAWGVGWYRDGTIPGSGSGAALVDGHVNDAFNTPGVFYELSSLTHGDKVTIIRGDDSELHYQVVKVSEEPLKNIDMKRVLSSVEPGKEGLNLITCGGKYDKATRTYANRVVVYTVRVS